MYVCGVGINDCPGWASPGKSSTENYAIYKEWQNMLTRCYNSKYHIKKPSYRGCRVCSRWLTLSNFASDIKKLKGYRDWKANGFKGYALDKDIRVPGNKVYSPNTCQLIDNGTNSGECVPRTKSKKVQGIRICDGQFTIVFDSAVQAAEYFGLCSGHICSCTTGRRQSCGGYKWFKV